MFTKKPEAGDSVTKMGERLGGETKTERPKMIPSIIGEGLTITGNVASKGEIQVDGEIQGDIHCGSLLLGDTAQVVGGVTAEDIVVRGRVVGSIRGLRVTLQAQSHIEGDIIHQSLAIEQGAYFEGKSRRSDNPLEEVKASSAGSPRPVHKPSDFDSKPHDEASAPRAPNETRPTTRAQQRLLPVPADVGTREPSLPSLGMRAASTAVPECLRLGGSMPLLIVFRVSSVLLVFLPVS